MGLFDIPVRAGRSNDASVAKKIKTNVKAPATIKGGGSLADRIATAKALVEKNLGSYRDKYDIIRNEDALHDYITECIGNGVISIDTETDGLDPILNNIAGACIYTPYQKGSYIPMNHISYVTQMPVKDQLSSEVVKREFQRFIDKRIKVIMFNSKFDIRVLRNQVGLSDIYCTWDAYLAARLLNENEPFNSLKKLHQKYVLNGQSDAFTFEDLFKGIPFTMIPINTGYLYAARDPEITYELAEYQQQYIRLDSEREDMRRIAWVFHNIEMPCVSVVADMEDAGVLLDADYSKKLSEEYNSKLKQAEQKFYRICDDFGKDLDKYREQKGTSNKLEYPVNINSPTQIAILIYDVLKIESPDPKNPRGTGVDILEKIEHPVAKAILEYREIAKLISTYIEKLPECVNPKDGRIHCSFNQYGAATGRFSSSDPNLQNIPSHNKDIRKMFIASPGHVLMSSDYSQQEPKVMTQMCEDEKMMQAYRQGKDLYAQIASIAFNKPYEECLEFRPDGTTNKEGKERRSQAKSILLGILYGRGINSVAEQLHTTKQKAQEIQDKIFKGFPAIPKFERDSKEMALTKGYVTTLWGRKRRLPDLSLPEYEFRWKDGAPPDDDLLDFDAMNDPVWNNSEVPEDKQRYYLRKLAGVWGSKKRVIFDEALKEGIIITDNGGKIADADRQVVNARIQGSAADMSKLAMILVGNDEGLKKLGFKLLIPVHDELIAECPEENAKRASERFAFLMSEAAKSKLKVPISCDVEITREWYGEVVNI